MTTVFVASLGALLPVTNPVFAVATYAGLTEAVRRGRSGSRRLGLVVAPTALPIVAGAGRSVS